jgi:hypothetical protein
MVHFGNMQQVPRGHPGTRSVVRPWRPAAVELVRQSAAGAIGIGGAASQIGDPGRISVEYIVRRDERPPLIRYFLAAKPIVSSETLRMRFLELALAGVLALAAPMATHAAPLGLNIGAAGRGPAPGVMQAGDAHGANWLPAPRGGGGGWHPPHWGPNRLNGGWGPYGGTGVPNYYIWVPGSAIFDDPFPDWRGPDGGWGNP